MYDDPVRHVRIHCLWIHRDMLIIVPYGIKFHDISYNLCYFHRFVPKILENPVNEI